MDLRNFIESVDILNIDKEESTVSKADVVFNTEAKSSHYIMSDADEELLILVQFKQYVNLQSIQIYGLKISDNDDDDDMSPPKQIHIYKTKNLNINFDDLRTLSVDKSINCSIKKLAKGQKIKLQKQAKTALKFKSTKYLAIYVESNQATTQTTSINLIKFKGQPLQRIITEEKQSQSSKDAMPPKQKVINENCDIVSCTYLKRLAMGLKYYNLLVNDNTFTQTKETKQLFVQYCNEKYTQFLDDFAHCLGEHGDTAQLLAIYSELTNKYKLKQCDLSKCNKLIRHYELRENKHDTKDNVKENDEIEANFNFYCDCYDLFHHQFFHLFRLGLRINPATFNQNSIDQKQDADSWCADKIFAKSCDLIRNRRKCALDLKILRYNEPNNKYNWSVNYGQPEPYASPSQLSETNTFLDDMYRFIEENTTIEIEKFVQLKHCVVDNEYDSDALQDDFNDFTDNGSNIRNIIENETYSFLIQSFVRNIRLASVAFSTGFIYFYWDYFKFLTEKEMGDKLSGYSPSQLFVLPHFANLKLEILISGFVSITQWNNKIILKGNSYHQTETSKNIKCKIGTQTTDSHHEIPYEDPISPQHLYCIILYTDWSKLSCFFSGTFRKKHEYESLQSLKSRHSKFYHFSKGLVEAVNDFGIRGYGDKGIEERGPFYTGITTAIKIPSFVIYLKGPCSTTKIIEVAINFATRDGIVLSFQNDQIYEGYYQRFLDCSWISKYSDENERIFIAGNKRLRVESLRIIESRKNYELFVQACVMFDHMISGVGTAGQDRYDGFDTNSSEHVLILDKLINNKMDIYRQRNEHMHAVNQEFAEYVVDTFDLFLSKKTKILINMVDLYKYFSKLNHLIVHSVVDEGWYRKGPQRILQKPRRYIDHNNNIDSLNVLNTKILHVFSNLKQVVIKTTYGGVYQGYDYPLFRFSLFSFLSAIDASKQSITYIIKAEQNYWKNKDQREQTWLNGIVTTNIKQQFMNKGWDIIESKEKTRNGYTDCLTIS
eukprot:515819_1